MRKLFKTLSFVIAGVITLVLAFVLFIHFMPGYGLFFVRSDSMSPVINAGDMVITGPSGVWPLGELAEGDVVTFNQGNSVVTHRIITIEEGVITTKGDANEIPDSHPIHATQIIGVKLLSVPKIGYVNSFISDRRGWFIAVILPAIILIGWIIKDIIKEAVKEDKKKNKANGGGDSIEGK